MKSLSRVLLNLVFAASLFTSATAAPAPASPTAGNLTASSLDEVTLVWGQTTSQPLQLTNSGDKPISYTITEQAELPAPPAPTVPRILVVNDGSLNHQPVSAFTTALTNLGYSFDETTSNTWTGISAELTDYDLVIYAGLPSLVNANSGQEILQLQYYLDAGGRLLLADNDFGNETGTTSLYKDYFQAAFRKDDGAKGSLTGIDLMQGINPSISSDPYPDDFTLKGPEAVGIFQAASGNWAGLRIARRSYRAIYLAWDFHYAGTSQVGELIETEILDAALGWILADIGPDAIPWLRELPTTGTLAAGASQQILLDYDARESVIPQPGTYSAVLSIRESPESAPIQVPVVMHVQPSANHGLIRGSLTGTGYCDAETIRLSGASVTISNSAGFTTTLKTDAGGAYQYWVAAGGSPYVIEVSAEGHAFKSAAVSVGGGQTVTQDFVLRWEKPCISLSQPALSVSATMFTTHTLPLTLTNRGAVATPFEISEVGPSSASQDAPWLSVSPGSGTLAPEAGQQRVEVTFDTGSFDQPGRYQAGLLVQTHDPVHPAIDVPVTLDLQAPDTWGQVTGVVTRLGECDALSEPLPGAQVVIENAAGLTRTLEADAGGHYQFWAESGTYSAVVSAPGHLSHQIDPFTIDSGQTTRRDVSLRLAASCVALAPDHLNVDLVLGQRLTLPITLTNQGALPGAYELLNFSSDGSPSGWLSAVPVTGTLPPDGGMTTGAVTFDAGQVSHPGLYQGVLRLHSDNPVRSPLDFPVQMIVAAPTYGVKMSAPTISQSALPGTNVRYELEIENLGNLNDTFLITASGNRWPTTVPGKVTLAAGETQSLEVEVEVPETATSGVSDALTVTAVSQADPKQTASIVLTTLVPRRCGVSLSPSASALTASPGQQVEYLLRLTNTGSASDTYTLSMTGSHWPVELPETLREVEAGATVEVKVWVTVPADAKSGAQDVTTVTAASTGDEQTQASAVLTTTVGPPTQTTLFLPLARK